VSFGFLKFYIKMNTKKIYLILASTLISFSANCQINLDSIWQQQVVDNYKKYDNYTAEIVTTSTIRGKFIRGIGEIDTTYNIKDTTLFYVENKNFVGVQSKNSISYTANDTNTTINFQRKFIAINSLQDDWGKYFNDVSIHWETHFYTSIIGYRKFFKKIDKISDIGDYFVFECVDSATNLNDIQMYEDVKMYVNKDNYLLEKIITKRQNNTIAELGLGAIEREIIINYLEFNQPNSIYKTRFNTNFYYDFPVIKNGSPYEELLKKAKELEEKFEKSKQPLNKKLLNCEIVGFEKSTIKLNDVKGWLLFDTWNAACIPCFDMMKEVSLNKQEFEKRGVTIVSLNTYEEPSDYLKAFCEKQKVNIPELYFFKNKNDFNTFKNQLKIFPSIFLISPDKKVVWQTTGKKSVSELLQEIDKFIKK